MNAPAPAIDRSSPLIPGTHFQFAWDSTSLGLLKECPRKYYYEILCGWRPKRDNVHLTFGLLYHAALEAYDHYAASIGKLDGNLTDDEHMEGILASVDRAMTHWGEYVHPVCEACHGHGFPSGVACELCNGAGHSPAAVWQPWQSDDANKNPYTLLRTIVWYLDHFRHSPLRTITLSNGKPAVELSFAWEGGEVNGITYLFCGHIDRMVIDPTQPSSRPSPHDRKTTKSAINAGYWRQFAPHNQFSLYSATCALHYTTPTWGITVDAAQILVGESRFARQFIPFPPQVIAEWLDEANTYITQAALYAEKQDAGRGEQAWPRNDKSCSNYGGCPFIKVCNKGASHRLSWLTADFTYKPWNPLIQRGDI